MFLLSLFRGRGLQRRRRFALLWLIAALRLYLTDFLKCTFRGENAQNRAFSGGEKLKAAAVYCANINQGAAQ
jgi:hypothetical protein